MGYNNGYYARPLPWHYIGAAIVAIIGFVIYFSRTSVNPTTGEKQHIALTVAQETQLGLESAPEMARQMGGEVDSDDPASEEVRKVGENVVENSSVHKSPYHFQFHLLRDPQTVNAFALPGGQIFITRGLLDRLHNESELAAVLGHEEGHVVGRHSAEQMAKTELLKTLTVAVGVAASDRDHLGRGYTAAMLADYVAKMKGLQYSRQHETQADELGLTYMSEAGYDPHGMEDVMRTLAEVTPTTGRPPEFLQTHPFPENRMRNIKRWIYDRYPAGLPAKMTKDGFGAKMSRGVPVEKSGSGK